MTTYQEPQGNRLAGHLHFQRAASFYEQFMEEQEIPIVTGMGIRDTRDVTLAPWKRMGGKGAFIQLDGTEGLSGMYLVEVPAAGELNPERHVYEERMLVIEGRGSTEVWREGGSRKQTFEWQPGSLMSFPLNISHRLVNATSSPALLLGVTNAPPVMNVFQNASFIFDNPFEFTDRYQEAEDYFRARDELEPHPESGRAMLRSNIIPDIAHCYLPLDNNRGPGYRWINPQMAGNTVLSGFIAEYPSGRYSKAHFHESGAILVCLRGKGYSYNWLKDLGARPWETSNAHQVKLQEYVPGGMVAAAPGGGNWFHQHFSIGRDPLRVINITGGTRQVVRPPGRAGEQVAGVGAEISQGGRALSYQDEDPQVRKAYQEALAREGVNFRMPEAVYMGGQAEEVPVAGP